MTAFDPSKHWENVYATKALEQVSWYQSIPTTSLEFVKQFNLPTDAKIIDIGGGDSYLVDHLLDLGYTDITVLEATAVEEWGAARVSFGSVEVTSQVVSFLRRRVLSGEVLGEEPLDLPERVLQTRAVWWTVTADQVQSAALAAADLPGAAHAAEHASIGLLPLFATCDRWDIGGVSTAQHADTGEPTVFVYDGHAGGAGFAERGFAAAQSWLSATRDAIAACTCPAGCPSCVQSPKCGNANFPLDKAGAVRLLGVLLTGCPAAVDAGSGKERSR